MEFKRESVFISAIRSFAKVFCGFIGFMLGAFILFFFVGRMGSHVVMPKTTVHVVPDAQGITRMTYDSAPILLRLKIEGVIGSGKLDYEKFEKVISEVQSNPMLAKRLAGVMLYINSPGGVASDSTDMYATIQSFKKRMKVPVYSYVNGICASGAYQIACASDKIYANDAAMIGSVGTIFGPVFNFSEVMEKVGVSSKTITAGKDKDALNPFRPWKSHEGEEFDDMAKQCYEQFLAVVLKHRPKLTRDLLVNKYGAKVFLSEEAEKYGYIDVANVDYMTSLQALAEAANIKEDDIYQVLEVRITPSLFSDLVEQRADMLTQMIQGKFISQLKTQCSMSGQVLHLYQP